MKNTLYVPDSVVLEPLVLPWLTKAKVEVAVLRLDKTDTIISGNKWFKLHHHVEQAFKEQAQGLISFGGPHSNHLHAFAAAGAQLNLPTVGLVRGDPKDTETVKDLQDFGMTVHWLSYGDYRRRYQVELWQEWLTKYSNYYIVPEGGTGVLGAKGCRIIPQLINQQLASIGWSGYEQVYIGVGTGSTLAGIIWGEEGKHLVVGCLAVPARYQMDKQIAALLAEIPVDQPFYQLQEAARKGFGQVDSELLAFMNEVEQQAGLPLDPVYTAKTLYCLKQQVIQGLIPSGYRIIFVHSGGLQGRRAVLGKW